MHGGRVEAANWSADGSTLVTLGRDGGVVLLDMTGQRRVGAVLTGALDARTLTLWPTPHAVRRRPDRRRPGWSSSTRPTAPSFPPRTVGGPDAVETARTGRWGICWSPPTTLEARRSGTSRPVGYSVPSTCPNHSSGTSLRRGSRRTANLRRPFATPTDRSSSTSPRARCSGGWGRYRRPETEGEVSVQGWTADGRSILISRHLSTTTSDLLVVDATSGAVKLQVRTGAAMPGEATAVPDRALHRRRQVRRDAMDPGRQGRSSPRAPVAGERRAGEQRLDKS